MASLQILKKHLGSVRMTGQLAGAMKTVSAAKLSRLNGALQAFSAYDTLCQSLREKFGEALDEIYPVKNPDAPVCYVILGANRGLCGGYNMELYHFVSRILAEQANTGVGARFLVTGKHAIAHYQDGVDGIVPEKTWILPDVVQFADGDELFSTLMQLYQDGKVSAVTVLYQRFVNMLTQTPAMYPLLPMQRELLPLQRELLPMQRELLPLQRELLPMQRELLPLQREKAEQTDTKQNTALSPLCIPDKKTVLSTTAHTCLRSALHNLLLESAAGHQAATLVAMRSAYDNAETSAAALEAKISRQRQSDVTSSVIETSGMLVENT